MNRRLLLQATVAAALGVSAPCWFAAKAEQAAKPSGPSRQAMVIQVSEDDPAKWMMALGNARNLQNAMGAENVDIQIVTFGPGILMLKRQSPMGSRVQKYAPAVRPLFALDSTIAPRIAEAQRANIKMLVCENTMYAFKLTKEDMLPGIQYVQAGVAEIMEKQREGWTYLRP